MKPYDPKNWYWYVGGDRTSAYSSAVGDYVQANNTTFQEWLSDGSLPTNIDTEANLGAVLSPYYPDVQRPVVPGVLDGYQQAQADDIFTRKLIKFLFVLHNDVRVLKGQQPHTIAQARAYFRRLM